MPPTLVLLLLTAVAVSNSRKGEWNKQLSEGDNETREATSSSSGGTTLLSRNNEYTCNQSTEQTRKCPTWMYCMSGSEECVCGVDNHHTVKCSQKLHRVYILHNYQMTYDEQLQEELVGASFYDVITPNSYDNYHAVPVNKSQLNEAMCGQFSRRGRLCGACKVGHSPLVYSYKLHCKRCSEKESRYNIVKYIGVSFIPLTVFYIIVLVFKLNANSPTLHGFILYAQLISAPFVIRELVKSSFDEYIVVQVLATLYGIWNLDFFRTLYPDVCLRVTTLWALSLDYAIAFYPLLLIFLTCIVFKLHSYGCRVILVIAFLIRKCLLILRKDSLWNERASMIDVFATFLLLSYGRIMSVSLNLLTYTSAVNPQGITVGRYLFYDATYQFFGKDHLPYGVLALVLFTCFNVLPFLLLILYPMRWFQRCLNHLGLSSITLHTFVDTFAGCYKDGTEPGSRDCRYFAGIFLLVRMFVVILYTATLTEYFFGISAVTVTGILMLYIIFQPYKAKYAVYNKITAVMIIMIILSILGAQNVLTAESTLSHALTFSIGFFVIIAILPQLFVIIVAIRWTGICKHKHFIPLYSRATKDHNLVGLSEESRLIAT